MPKIQTLENITIEKLIFGGKGLATARDGRKIIITGGCIPGAVVDLRILKEKKSHYEAQELRVVKKSSMEVPLPEGFQMYGGAKWLTIGYGDQLRIKAEQVKESFHHIKKWISEEKTSLPVFHPIIASPEIYGYRNKVEFSWGKYISAKEEVHDDFRFGFHAQGQFDRIIDCTYCALADAETNAIFLEVDRLSRDSGHPTYDPKTGVGFWRHFVVRRATSTQEQMLIFSINSLIDAPVMSTTGDILSGNTEQDFSSHPKGRVRDFFTDMVGQLTEKYPNIASIYFLENTGKADIVTGNPVLLFGKPAITADLLGLSFEIQPKSFFQVNTLGAEKLYTEAIGFIKNKGGILLDLYAGTGTIGILLAKYFSKVYSVELIESASRDGEKNAVKNGITNVEFVCGKAEDFAKQFLEKGGKADTIVIDPPRDGMHPSTIPSLLSFGAKEIIYVSCNPATLARDLEVLAGKTRDEKTEKLPRYRITDITPVDMFPHTHHIETVVRMELV